MNFLTALLYDAFMSPVEKACLDRWRKNLLSDVRGNVLEIGAGTGANLPYYSEKVNRLLLMEPDAGMRRQLKAKVSNGNGHPATIAFGTAEKIDAEDAVFDAVTSSLVFCSVSHLETALLEAKRVLKKGGKFVFLEHVAAKRGTTRRKWQNRTTPLWRAIAGNCHLNRDTEKAILAAGFSVVEIKRENLQTIVPLVKPTIRGIAIKP
jgi:ubiquinone/menaquinone biosynthesis C-methylase UbiE